MLSKHFDKTDRLQQRKIPVRTVSLRVDRYCYTKSFGPPHCASGFMKMATATHELSTRILLEITNAYMSFDIARFLLPHSKQNTCARAHASVLYRVTEKCF